MIMYILVAMVQVQVCTKVCSGKPHAQAARSAEGACAAVPPHSLHAWARVVVREGRLGRKWAAKLVLAHEHVGDTRLVAHNEQLVVEVRDVELARARERAGEQEPLPEQLHLNHLLLEPYPGDGLEVGAELHDLLVALDQKRHLRRPARLRRLVRGDGHVCPRKRESGRERRGQLLEELDERSRRVSCGVESERKLPRRRIH
mmetsp:Transcript_9262/g.28036  ORF Transcript_9262/g.28036 Transcript_9262/m.28036 type:complete len:202 (-) Transcript_9262:277-882(-)